MLIDSKSKTDQSINNFIKLNIKSDNKQNFDSTLIVIPILEKQKVSNNFKMFSNINNKKLMPNNNNLTLRSNVTLLEKIIKTHPVWYLPHLGRAASNHLLRFMPPGVILFYFFFKYLFIYFLDFYC